MQTGMVGLRRKGRDRLRRLLRGGQPCVAFERSPGSSREGAAMSDSRSDRPLLFATTRDLAYQKIFAALEAVLERGRLEVPVTGAAQPDWSLVIQKHLLPLNHFSEGYGVQDGHIMLSVWAAAPLEPTRKGTFQRPLARRVQQSPASRATVRQSGFLKPEITRSKS
jgi:hypothetical protein